MDLWKGCVSQSADATEDVVGTVQKFEKCERTLKKAQKFKSFYVQYLHFAGGVICTLQTWKLFDSKDQCSSDFRKFCLRFLTKKRRRLRKTAS